MKREEELTVSVKPLEWVSGRPGAYTLVADTPIRKYTVWDIGGRGYWTPDDLPGRSAGGDIEAAKAAAQADYEARIRSALLHTSKPEVNPSGYLFEMRYPSDRWSGPMFAEAINLPEGDYRNVVPLYAHPPKPEATEGGTHEKGIELDDKTIVRLAREHFSEKDYDRLTYEKSPPMFPQATYDVPTYALSQFVKAVRAALTAKQTD